MGSCRNGFRAVVARRAVKQTRGMVDLVELAAPRWAFFFCVIMISTWWSLWSSCCSIVGADAAAHAVAARKRILLVRHGESEFNRDGRFQGSLRGIMQGPKLTKLGHRQAKELGRLLEANCGSLADASVKVSPLRRARQTWKRIKSRLDIPGSKADAWGELREIDLFEWEGQTMEAIASQYPEQWRRWLEEPWNMELASGIRPVTLLLQRAMGVWTRLCMETPEGGTVLVVAHGALNRAVLLKALRLPDEAYADPVFRFPNCGAAELEVLPSQEGMPSATRWRWLASPPAIVSQAGSEAGESFPQQQDWRSAVMENARYAS